MSGFDARQLKQASVYEQAYDDESDGGYEQGSEEDEDEHKCTWVAEPSDSCYDDGLLKILTLDQKWKKGPFLKFMCSFVSLVMLLAFNAGLQFAVIYRVWEIVENTREGRTSLIFAPTGNCAHDPAYLYTKTGNTLFDQASVKQPLNWACGSVYPMAMSNNAWLDVDGDGYWSAADSLEATGAKINVTFSKGGFLPRFFKKFIQEARDSKMTYQIQNPTADFSTLTSGFTKIPMTWMTAEVPAMKLCNNFNPALCGNLEMRNILKSIFPDPLLTSDGRVAKCKENNHRCKRIFGELYSSYSVFAEQQCGDKSSTWLPQQEIIVNRYATADKYDPKEDKQAVTTGAYESFLLLILVIWWLIVLTEVRQVMAWWFVIVCYDSEGGTVVKGSADDEDSDVVVQSISCLYKVILGIAVLLPRTLIIILLGWIGNEFLVIADSYGDLILNSVALGFLIEVDEMLFSAVTSVKTRRFLGRMQPLEAKHSCCWVCTEIADYPSSLPLTILVVLGPLLLMLRAYRVTQGKDDLQGALACMCHMEGSACVAAQILGGLVRVPP